MSTQIVPIPESVAKDVEDALESIRDDYGDDYDVIGLEVAKSSTASGKPVWVLRIEVDET